MQDVMDEKGTGFVWQPGMVREKIVFGDDECLCMRAYVEHRRVDTQQVQEPIDLVKCGESCSCPWQPRPQEGYVDIQTAESRMGLEDTHQWTGPTHKRARCWRYRWWHWFWLQHCASRPTLIEWVVRFSMRSVLKLSTCISIVYTETVSMYMYIVSTNTGYI